MVWQAPERYGYAGQSRYLRGRCCQRQRGEWCLPTWGDDGIMQTSGWDETIRAQKPGSVIWVDGNVPGPYLFPDRAYGCV